MLASALCLERQLTICVCVCVCVYIYMYIYIYILLIVCVCLYIYIYIYILLSSHSFHSFHQLPPLSKQQHSSPGKCGEHAQERLLENTYNFCNFWIKHDCFKEGGFQRFHPVILWDRDMYQPTALKRLRVNQGILIIWNHC